MNISEKIKALRIAKNLTQQQAAKLTGIDQSRLSRVESNTTQAIDTDLIEKLCEGYAISSQYFFLDIPIDVQRKLDKYMGFLDKLVSLPTDRIEDHIRMIEFDYNNHVIVQANLPFKEKYGMKKNKTSK